jgi:hypothetical protein
LVIAKSGRPGARNTPALDYAGGAVARVPEDNTICDSREVFDIACRFFGSSGGLPGSKQNSCSRALAVGLIAASLLFVLPEEAEPNFVVIVTDDLS